MKVVIKMLYHILFWLFVGLYAGQIAHRCLNEGRWLGYYGDLAVGIAGSEIGGLVWLYSGQPEGLLGALFFSVLGASCLLLFMRLVGIRRHHQRVFDELITIEGSETALASVSIPVVNRINASTRLNPIKIIHIKAGSIEQGHNGALIVESSTFTLSDVQQMPRKLQTTM